MSVLLLLLLSIAPALADAPYADRLARVDAQLLLSPDDPSLLTKRGRLLRRAGRLDEAEAALRKAGDLPDARVELAELHRARGDDAQALASLEGLDHRGAWILRGDLLKERQPTDALAAWDRALARGQDPDLHLRRARLAASLGRVDDSLAVLRAAIDQLGGAIVLRLERARIALDGGRPEVARIEATALLTLSPDRSDWHLLQADAEEALGRDPIPTRQQALALARQRLETRPTDLNRVAVVRALLALDQTDDARALLSTLGDNLAEVRALKAEAGL